MSRAAPLIVRRGETATRYERQIGGRDTETGWPQIGYISTGSFEPDDFDCDDFDCFEAVVGVTISLFVVPTSEVANEMDAGLLTVSQFRIITGDVIAYLDHIIYKGDTYVIDTEPQLHYLLGAVQYRNATMTKVT